MEVYVGIILCIVGLLVGGGIGFFIYHILLAKKKTAAEKEAKRIVREADVKADHIRKEAQNESKRLQNESRQQAQAEARQIKSEAVELERRLNERESVMNQRDASLNKKEDALEAKNKVLEQKISLNEKKTLELEEKTNDIIKELEKVAGLTSKEAHDEIMRRVEEKMASEIAVYIKNAEDEARDNAENKARDLLALACDKYAQDVVTERTVSVIALPNDEIKGRIIGREGRNIKILQQTLGVDILVDDTPEVISVTCFNPIRREIARRTIETLVKDGRIQPGRIEEVADKITKDLESETQRAGIDAANKLGLPRINRELLGYLGRMKYRTSYGQNALQHSIEVGYLCGIMAGELGLDQSLARRAGLLHDIGKSVDFEREGSHVALGAELARKCGEPEIVINSIESHHGDVEAKSVIAYLVRAADTLSAARPGARSETMETYIKRINQLEEIASSFDGVEQAFAMQAGREIRVMVIPDKISDAETVKLAMQIRQQIENTMTYPGQIKVSVIREYKANEIAK